AHLLARRGGNQWCGQRERFATLGAADQVAPGQNIEPLVVAADLQNAAVFAIQVQEVERLDQRVIQLDTRKTSVLEALPVRAVLHQLVDGEVAADITQKLDPLQVEQPVGVVDHQRAIARKIQ